MNAVFLVGGVRTAQGRYGGALAAVRPDDLAAIVMREVIRRADLKGDLIDEVILGAANQAGEDNRDVARMAALLAGLPDSVTGYTVNRLCASGLTAVANAVQAIGAGSEEIIVAGGVESMTRAPWVMAKPASSWARPGEIFDTSLGWRFTNPVFAAYDAAVSDDASPAIRRVTLSMGETAENVAALDGITREASDAFSFRSHERANAAIDAGLFTGEIVAVPTQNGDVVTDEGPRRDTSLETLSRLRPIFRTGGIVTAGSSSQLSDGASAILVASEAAINRNGLTPRARVVSFANAGVQPNLMGLGPVPATEKALARARLSIDDIDTVELNEAFAAQSLAVIGRLGLNKETVNSDGGAIALGHPLGSSGTRILVTLLGRMERDGSRYGLATLCVGVGQGVSMIVERV
jgi:acetyl-CoA acetyltransferase family protein